jgi:hypothetical protein
MKAPTVPSELARRQMLKASWSLSLSLTFLALALGMPARSQEPSNPEESIVDAARNARERKPNPTAPPKIFTNDDLAVQSPLPAAAAIPPESSPEEAEAPAPQKTDCHNPADDERLKMELQAAQEELDQVRRELSYDPKVISNGDVDLKNFKSGSSGLAFGSPPLLQSQPQSPARINEVMLEEKVASLKQASRIACDSPEDAKIQRQLDSAEGQLKSLRREFDLDQSAYYSKPNYAEDTAGKAKLDAEQQQIESLQSEIESLKSELPQPKTNQVAE